MFFDSQPDLNGWDGGSLFTYGCTFMFSCVLSLLSWYHQTIFLEELMFIFFDIRWVFFLGVDISMTVSHFVLEKVSYEPHLKLPYRSSQKPHTLSYESRKDRFKSFHIHVWDLLVIQSTVACLFFILALLCVEEVVDKNGQIMCWKSPQMVRPLSLCMLGFPPPKWD